MPRLSRYTHGLTLALLAGLVFAATPAAAQPACGDVITQDTTLTADLYCGGPVNQDASLIIGADGITLDLGGHTLSAGENYRIVNNGHDNVTIRNGTIYSDQGAIHISNASGNVISNIHAGGLIAGIWMENTDNSRFVHNHVQSVTFSLSGSHNVIAHNLVTHYESSFGFTGDYNRIVDNVVWGGFGRSLFLRGNHNAVRRNVFLNDSFFVVTLSGANDTDFVNNTIGDSHHWVRPAGAVIANSNGNRFVRNKVFGVAQGFDLRSGADNVFRSNDVSGGPIDASRPQYETFVPDGFAIASGVTGTILRDNTVHGFDDDGFDVDAAGTSLKGNGATGNHDLGIEAVSGVIDAGGNTASGNGNPLQCTNVFCG